MSEESRICDRFDPTLLDGADPVNPEWTDHLEACDDCRGNWQMHQMIIETIGEDEVPELSPVFQAGLEWKLAAVVEVRPLRGWRRFALIAYAMVALFSLGWALRNVPLPTIDLSSPWVPLTAFIAVPLTLMLAIAVSRWLPVPGRQPGLRAFAV